jgi:hypothetical protein
VVPTDQPFCTLYDAVANPEKFAKEARLSIAASGEKERTFPAQRPEIKM